MSIWPTEHPEYAEEADWTCEPAPGYDTDLECPFCTEPSIWGSGLCAMHLEYAFESQVEPVEPDPQGYLPFAFLASWATRSYRHMNAGIRSSRWDNGAS